MIISGDVEKIIFRNEDNGYTVVDLRSSGDYVTAVGVFPEIYEGMRLELTGDYKYHARHGLQFLAESVKVVEPDGAAAIEKFLKSGIFKGVGEVTARNIVERFGERTLDVMKTSPEKLAEVKGISAKKAAEICATLREHGEMQDTLVYLQRFDVSLNLALKIYKTYGARTEEVIKTNPYQLISDVERVGFQTADKIAQEVGITKDSDFRIRAGIIYTLKEASNKSGHTALPDDILKKELLSLLGFDETYLEKVECNIEDLIFLAEIKDYVVDNARFYMLYKSYLTEKTIARRLALLEAAHGDIEVDFSEQIDKFEEMCGIKLHEKQREAVSNSLNSGVHVITGGPGTGKTTAIKGILSVFERQHLEIALAAPTGRAAKRMTEVTGVEAKTIHRLLEVEWDEDDKPVFRRNLQNPLDCNALILDELSMVDISVFASLLDALPLGCRLVLVGDSDQLPPVGAGNVLHDLIVSDVLPVVELSHVFRQALSSKIITNAHKIVSGEMPDLSNNGGDFFHLERTSPQKTADTVRELCASRLKKAYNWDAFSDIQVICPSKKGETGTVNLNRLLQEALNPKDPKKSELFLGAKIFRTGDKVMQIKNNYNIEWESKDEKGVGIFNGDIGIIKDIDQKSGIVTVDFDGRKAELAAELLGDLDLAYAITVHKSQGSEFNAVIIPVFGVVPNLAYRNLLYTAVTRAKNMLITVGSGELIKKMTENDKKSKRYSALPHFLKSAF